MKVQLYEGDLQLLFERNLEAFVGAATAATYKLNSASIVSPALNTEAIELILVPRKEEADDAATT